MLGNLVRDVRFALRSFRRNPGFAGVAVLTLALGIGATTAVFAVAKNVLLDPLPFERADELVMVFEENAAQNIERDFPSPPNYADWRRQNRTFVDLAALTDGSATLSRIETPTVVQLALVSPNTFSLLGVEARIGRALRPGDAVVSDAEGSFLGATVAVISDGMWHALFGADPGVLGRTVRLNDTPVEIVGVMPPSFAVPRDDVDFWLPADFDSPSYGRQSRYLRVFGRLAGGVSAARAEADLDRIQARIAESFPEANAGWTADVVPVRDAVVGGGTRSTLALLLGAVGFVLLIACANVANLLLGRSTTRDREIGVRLALGASRKRVAGQLLSESLVLGLAGAAVGIALAHLGVQALVAVEPGELPRLREIGVDTGSLLFALAAAVLTAALFGLAPAVHAVRPSVVGALKGTLAPGRGGPERARSALVVVEVAFSLMLLVGAGLLLRSLLMLGSVDPGFEPDGVVIARVNLGDRDYPSSASQRVYFDEMLRRLRETPAVTEAGVTSVLPMDPAGIDFDLPYLAEGHPVRPEGELPQTDYRIASDGYFEAMGIEVVQGRGFSELDRPETARVLVVNETLAGQLWPGEDPVGKTITIYYVTESPWQVVGVVRDTRHRGLGASAPAQMFVPLSQAEVLFGYMQFAVKAAPEAGDLAQRIRAVGAEVDPKYPLYDLSTMRERIAATTRRDRFVATVLGGFALLALVLAAVGIHGVIAYQVALRTREIGLRMALGAARGKVVGGVMARAAALAGVGVAVGIVGAALATRALRSLLYEVSPLDPVTFAAMAAVLMGVALVAAATPAMRAARMDPAGALRSE